ncbi:MAG: hypothetical protein BSR46_06785 [Candidatus Dactylopiibacterium carminicum]|nr:SurA N-terminal domain-containing protein [Candidatus Dactylopiibacterium carminicum]PAS99682.1 MAG: hypothetical protein BSR46_06785 [Candidatus Dactylopiibacterium carminicum]
MFDAVRNSRKFVQIILVLIALTFALFGMDAYQRMGAGEPAAAVVGKVEISNSRFDQALREQEYAMRDQMGEAFDRSMIENPEFRAGVLDRLINETAIRSAIIEGRIVVPDSVVQEYISKQAEFQENGHFSLTAYDVMLRSMGMTRDAYQQRIRETLAQQQLLMPVLASALAPKGSLAQWRKLESEQRTVAEWRFDNERFKAEVKLDDASVRKFYDDHPKRFEAPEQVKVEYVVLRTGDLQGQVEVTEADARQWYDSNRDSFGSPEKLRASHILVQSAEGDKSEDRAAARKKAEDLLTQVKAQPGKFAELAQKSSDDPGSASKGGDLGFFGRNVMAKPFEDAVFALKPQEISGIVETQFGFHIIQLTDKRGGVKPFEQVKAEALAQARKQAASRRFAEQADAFSDEVLKAQDALQPVAEKFGLKLEQSDWFARNHAPEGVLANPKLLAAVFSGESVRNRLNIEAIDLGDGTMVTARVLEYKPLHVQAFEEVKGVARMIAEGEAAAALAQVNGEEALEALRKGEAPAQKAAWSASRVMTRGTAGVSAAAGKQIFGVKSDVLPAYVGVKDDNGFALYRVEKIEVPQLEENEAEQKALASQYASMLGQEDLRAFIAGLRDRAGVKINQQTPVAD